MSKRPAIDLAALTSEAAAPMTEAAQRAVRPALTVAVRQPVRPKELSYSLVVRRFLKCEQLRPFLVVRLQPLLEDFLF